MKKAIFSYLLIIGISGVSSAQVLNAEELMTSTNCLSFTCFNQFAEEKGFSYDSVFPEGDNKYYLYIADNPTIDKANGTRNAVVGGIDKTGRCVNAGLTTASKSYYETLLREFANLGFILKSTQDYNGVIRMRYESTDYKKHSLLVSIQRMTKGVSSWTSYTFTFGLD